MPNDNTGGWPDAEREARIFMATGVKAEGANRLLVYRIAELVRAREAAAALAMKEAVVSEIDDPHDDSEMRSYARFFIEQIRALPLPAAAQAALDAVVQAAVEREREACAGMFDGNALWVEAAIAAAIRARREVGHDLR